MWITIQLKKRRILSPPSELNVQSSRSSTTILHFFSSLISHSWPLLPSLHTWFSSSPLATSSLPKFFSLSIRKSVCHTSLKIRPSSTSLMELSLTTSAFIDIFNSKPRSHYRFLLEILVDWEYPWVNFLSLWLSIPHSTWHWVGTLKSERVNK